MYFKNRSLIFSLIVGIAIFALVILGILPLLNNIKENSENLALEYQKVFLIERQNKELKNFKQRYEELKPELEIVKSLFVNQEVPMHFVNFLEKTTDDLQLSINISSVDSKVDDDSHPYLIFNIRVGGMFPNFLKFLEKLEKGPYLIKIAELKVSRAEDIGTVGASFKIQVPTKKF